MSIRLLSELLDEEAQRAQRGRLTIFFGFAPGVGKTYAMLKAARALLERGHDVAAGWIETHGRSDTEALAQGIDRIPPRTVDDEGILHRELDVDAAIARHPEVLLVDELAHRNAPGLRHEHRYEDIFELLDAGINVYTTLNVQYVESLNDVIKHITGVRVRETVPDAVLERADEIEVIDLPPDDLLQRLREGKVYVNEQAQRALLAFFRRGNLLALRELTLRRAAERVDTQMRDYRQAHGIAVTWEASERIAVSIGPSPTSARLVRAARRMAGGLRAPWYGVFVETPAFHKLPAADRARVDQHLKLIEQLDGKPVRLQGTHVAEALVRFARSENVTQIIVGKPTHARWRDIVYGSVLDDLLRSSGDIGVYAIEGDPPRATESSPKGSEPPVTDVQPASVRGSARRSRGHTA